MISIENTYVRLIYYYVRYVDDILILGDHKELQGIGQSIDELLDKTYHLKIHDFTEKGGKSCIGLIKEGFSYLGYDFNSNQISVKLSSKIKLEKSIEKLFSIYNNNDEQNFEQFMWNLNIRITGAIVEGKKYGWLFYFSQIDDIKLLHHLDSLVLKIAERYKIQKRIKEQPVKRFVRTYYEIRKNRINTNYIPNFDNYSIEDKKDFIKNVLKVDPDKLREEEIIKRFRKYIFKSIRELEKDVQSLS